MVALCFLWMGVWRVVDEQQAVPVAQEDREAAYHHAVAIGRIAAQGYREAFMSGEWDDTLDVRAFARHRLASLPCKSGEGAGVVMAEDLVEMVSKEYGQGYFCTPDAIRFPASSEHSTRETLVDILRVALSQEKTGSKSRSAILVDTSAAILALTPDATQTREAELVAALQACVKFIEDFRDDGPELLAEGVHAGLRKGSDAPDSGALHTAIGNSTTSAWSDAITFAHDPFFSMWGGDEAIAKARAALNARGGA